jgi:uncharacterized protein YdcH (DUF465 family)
MGADIYRTKYDFVLGSLSQEQIDFIDDIIYRSDDGTYELSNEDFREMKKRKVEFEKLYKAKLAPLFDAFSKEIKKGRGHFSFRVF